MILDRVLSRPRPAAMDPRELEKLIRSGFGGRTATGISVNSDSAMRAAAVFACVTVLAQSVAQLPCHLYRRTAGGTERAAGHPLHRIIHLRPNHFMSAYDFWQLCMAMLALRGNFYAYKVVVRGRIRELLPLHPDRVRVVQEPDWRVRYFLTDDSGREREIDPGLIVHFRGLALRGPLGLNPIAHMREVIGLALAAEKHGAVMFRNGARIGGVIRHPEQLSDEALQHLKDSIEENYSGLDNAHRTLILEEGMDWVKVGMTAEDAQFLETRKYQRSEIAGIFRVPPHMIGDLEKATFSNIEQQDLGFVKHTLAPWLVNLEQTVARSLLAPGEQDEYFCRFNTAALLRGDVKSRYEAYASAIQWGHLSPNEVRDLEDRNPRPGGDAYLRPLNMTTKEEE